MTISERVAARFSDVPSVTPADVAGWVAEAGAESGLVADGSASHDTALVFLAYAIGCETLATGAAHYFSYRDAEESVDKNEIFARYMEIAAWARRQFVKYRGGGAAFQTFPARGDGK